MNKSEDIIDCDCWCSLNVSQNTQLSRSFTRQAAGWIEWKRQHQYAEINGRWGEVMTHVVKCTGTPDEIKTFLMLASPPFL